MVAPLGEADVDIFLFGASHPRQLIERFGGDDDFDGLFNDLGEFGGPHGEAEAIGGGHRNGIACKTGADAGQGRPCVVGRGRKGHLPNHLFQQSRFDFNAVLFVRLGHEREFLIINALNGRLGAVAGDVHRVRFVVQGEDDLLGGQVVNQVAEGAGGNGNRPFLLYFGADPAHNRGLEIGGG